MKKIITFLKWILNKVNGKKATIGTILGLIVTLLLSESVISEHWAIFLNSLFVALGLVANYGNYKMDKKTVDEVLPELNINAPAI